MTVSELIEALKCLPQDAPVLMLWDNDLRTDVEAAWATQNGEVGVGPLDEVVYTQGSRIKGAPTDPYLTVYEMLGLPKPPEDD